MAIHRLQGPDGKIHRIEAPTDTPPEQLISFLATQLQQSSAPPEIPYERTYGDIASAAFNRGVGGIDVALGDELPAYLASIFGKDEYAREQLAEAEQSRQSLEERFPTQFQSYKDVAGIGDVGTYITEQFLGSALPSIATIGGTAATAALAAPLVGATAATMGTVGAALGGFGLMAPESFAGIYQETGQLEPAAATIAGAVNTALETALPARIFGKLTAPVKAKVVENILLKSGMQPSIARRAITETFKSAGLEGLTEGTQEAVNITAERVIAENPDAFGSEDIQRVMESFVAGAAGGAPFGGASGAVEVIRERSAAAAKVRADEAEKLRIQREKRELERKQKEAELEQAAAKARFVIPTDPKLLGAWSKDKDNLGLTSKKVTEALGKVAGKDIRDPAQAALVYGVLHEVAKKTDSPDVAIAIGEYLKKPFFEYARTGKPVPTPTAPTPPAGSAPPTPPAGSAPPTPPEMTDEEIADALQAAAQAEEAAARKDEVFEETGIVEEPSVQAKTVKTETQEPQVGQEAPQTSAPTQRAKTADTAPSTTQVGEDTLKQEEATFTKPVDENTLYVPEASVKRGNATYFATGAATSVGFDTPQPSKGVLNVSAVTAKSDRIAGETILIRASSDRSKSIAVSIDKLSLEISDDTGKYVRLDRGKESSAADIKMVRNALGDAAVDAFLKGGDDVVNTTAKNFLGRDLGKPFSEIQNIFSTHYSAPTSSTTPTTETTPTTTKATKSEKKPKGKKKPKGEKKPTGEKEEIKTKTDLLNAVSRKKRKATLPLTEKGKYVLPSLLSPSDRQIDAMVDESGNAMIDSLTNEVPWKTIADKLAKKEQLTDKELAAWFFHTYEPTTALIVMEAEATPEYTLPEKRPIPSADKGAVSRGEAAEVAQKDARAALDFINKAFSKTPNIQLVRAKIKAKMDALVAELNSAPTSETKEEEIKAMHLLSGFGRAVGVGDFYIGMGSNSTFDPSKSSDDFVERNDKVDKEIYKEPGETEDAVKEGTGAAAQDELLTTTSSFKAFKDAIKANLSEGEVLEDELKALGIINATQFKAARAEALQRRGNLSKAEADEVTATGELLDAVESTPTTVGMTAEQKQAAERELAALMQNYHRSGKTTKQLPAGPGGKEGGASGQNNSRYGRIISALRTPKFRGPDFNPAIRAAVEKGDIRAAINELIKSNSSNTDLVQLLRKLLPVIGNVKLTLDGGIPLFNSGMYVPSTDTVHLDSLSGMNEHTLLHEIFHAGLARIVGNPEHSLSKDFQSLFNAVKTQLGDAYGGTDMQEFGAELGGNPEFQALLKTIKAPRSGNLLERVWQMMLEYLGIAKRATAYDKAFKLVNDILDISVGLEPLPGEAMFLGGDPGKSMVDAIFNREQGTADEMLNKASEFKPKFLRTMMNFVSLNNKENMLEGTKIKPLLHDYMVAIQKKKAEQDRTIDEISREYEEKIASVERNPKYAAAWEAGADLMIDARLAHVELVDLIVKDREGKIVEDSADKPQIKKFEPKDKKQKEAYEELKPRFDALPKEVREAYTVMRQRLDDFAHQYVESIAALLDTDAKKDELRNTFYNLKEVIGYVPFLRFGDFWISFIDPVTKKYTAAAFESPRERAMVIAELIKTYPDLQDKITQRDSYADMVRDAKIPPSSFIAQLEINLKEAGASAEIISIVTELYARSYPQQALLQQFKKAKGIPGMSRDLGRAYATAAGKWVYRLTSLKHNGSISAKLATFNEEVRKQHGGDDFINTLAQSVTEAHDKFVLSPQVPKWSTALTQASALEYIAGSFSSAAVNVTGLMFMVHPMLSARYGTQALSVLANASLSPIKRLREAKGPYEELAKVLDGLDLLRNPLSKEILNRGKSDLADYSSLGTKVKEFLAWPFVKSEEYIRATTAIAAYELALKGGGPFSLKPASEEEAIAYAAKVIQDAHTAGMSETAAPYLQHPVGRIILTFKSIVLAQTAYMAQQFRNWWKDAGNDPEAKMLKRFARRYLLYTYGTSFALLGAKGLPFMGATTTLMRIIELLIPDDDDEPYDPREQVNGVFGDFLYRGLFATMLGVDVSERASLANDVFFRDDPQSIRDHGYVRTAMFNLFGPMGTYGINVERALREMASGENIYKGFEDIAPAFVRNGMRGYRYYLDGVTTRTGSPVVEDVNLWQAAVQSIGFTPAEVSDIYERRARAKTFETALLDIKSRILDKYFLGKSTNDQELIQEAQKEAAEFRRKHPRLMDATTLERSYKSRVSAEEEKLAGLRFSKALLPEIADKYFSD